MCFLTNLWRKGLFLEPFDFGIADKALWGCIVCLQIKLCYFRSGRACVFAFSMWKRIDSVCYPSGITAALQEVHRAPAFVWLALLLEASCLVTPSTLPDSSCASFFLPSFLAPLLPGFHPSRSWFFLLLHNLLLPLFLPCVCCTLPRTDVTEATNFQVQPRELVLQEVEWNLQLPLNSDFQQ